MNSYRVYKEDLSVPACTAGCPAGVDVPRHLRYIRQGRFDEALAVMLERNPFPAICGHACYGPCEAECGNPLFGEPVSIRALHRVAAEKGGEECRQRLVKAADTGKGVAIVGSGPSGLSAAWFLAAKGHDVTVFEAADQPGGMLRYGIPAYRLPKDVLDQEIGYIKDLGVKLITSSRIESVESLLGEGYDSVYLAMGTSRSLMLDIEGSELSGIVPALSFLKDVYLGNIGNLTGKVLVIGGGNVAIDSARTAVRLGASQVDLACLEPYEQMPAFESEIEDCVNEGVILHNSLAPQVFSSKKLTNSVGSIELQRVSRFSVDPEGGLSWDLAEGPESKVVLDADMVIVAIGQTTEVPQSMDIPLSRNGLVQVDSGSMATAKPGIFAGGDMVHGPASIINAIAHGSKAALSIDRYLGGDGNVDLVLAEAEEEVEVPAFSEDKEPRNRTPYLDLDKRLTGFKPVELALNESQAVEEARRCRDCDARKFDVTIFTENCRECWHCIKLCGPAILDQSDQRNSKGYRIPEVKEVARCVGCLECYYVCPEYAIEVKEVEPHG